jgi:hypothetical protein
MVKNFMRWAEEESFLFKGVFVYSHHSKGGKERK